MSGSKYCNVFSPITIKGVEFKNRLEMAPQSPGLADSNGFVTTELVELFRQPARGGVGVITIGSSHVKLEECRDEERQLSLSSDEVILPLSKFADMVHGYGALASIEVNYAGQDGMYRYTKHAPYGPSAGFTPAELINAQIEGRPPVRIIEMDYDKIQDITDAYAAGALRCKKAGFKMVMIHGAHGNCIGQFTSPEYNKRKDEYGGSLENRARFAIEVLDKVRKKCGEDFILEYRISADEIIKGGMHFDETVELIKMIQDKIDILHVSAGIHSDVNYMRYWMQPYNIPRMMNVHYAEKLRKIVDKRVKITTVGSIMNIKNAEEIIANGWADFVAMARAFVADPYMPKKYAQGREEDHRPCVRCNYCGRRLMTGKVMGCAVNPLIGRDHQFPGGRVGKAREQKRVAVVGGGPAGMQAVLTLRERGHEVTLYEKSGQLGGNLIPAAALPVKQDLREYREWLICQTKKSGTNIQLNTNATKELLDKENFDALIIAVGSTPIRPVSIPGINKAHVFWAPEADMGTVKTGKRVVIIGAGSIGTETGLQLKDEGKDVVIVDTAADFTSLRNANTQSARIILEDIKKKNIPIYLNQAVEEITDTEVVCRDRLTLKQNRYSADTVLLAMGMARRIVDIEALRHSVPETEVFIVGDARETQTLAQAVNSAFAVAVDI